MIINESKIFKYKFVLSSTLYMIDNNIVRNVDLSILFYIIIIKNVLLTSNILRACLTRPHSINENTKS